tara:strand:+ start:2872 stop:4149 length:1278 start_codon:yes stop_codon:yes gene_type:complete
MVKSAESIFKVIIAAALSIFSSFLIVIVIANTLDVKSFGTYSFILNNFYLIFGLPLMGSYNFLTKLISKEFSRKNYDKIRYAIKWGLYFVSIVSFTISFLVSIIYFLGDFENINFSFYITLFLLAFVFGYINCFISIFRAIKMGSFAQLSEAFIYNTLIISIFLLSFKYFDPVYAPIFSRLSAGIILLVLLIYVLNRKISLSYKEMNFDVKFFSNQLWIKDIFLISSFFGMDFLLRNIPMTYLGIFSTSNEIAYFQIALKFGLLAEFGLLYIGRAYQSNIVDLYLKNDLKNLQKLCSKIMKISLSISLFVLIVLYLFSEVFIPIFFNDPSYIKSITPMLIVAGSKVIYSYFGLGPMLLWLLGQNKSHIYILMIIAVIQLILSFYFIPIYGAIGTAIVVVFSDFLKGKLLNDLCYKKFGIKSNKLF